jgi:hypothetical protein
MNIAKNMEFIFVAAFVVAISASNAFAAPVAAPVNAKPVAVAAAKATPAINTIVVVGKRLSKAKRAA